MTADKRAAWIAWCAYALVVCAGVVRGGMWLDEMQVWCLARDSQGINGLFHAIRNEGHPPLWPLLVKGLTLVFHHPFAMAALHASFALGTAHLVLLRAPWPLAWRIAVVFGYFFLFEYAVIARNYGPGMFFLIAAAAAQHERKPQLVMLSLMALSMTHLWGIIVASAWSGVMLFDRESGRTGRLRYVAVMLVAVSALWLAMPSVDLPYMPSVERVTLADLPDRIGRILGQVFLPFPDLVQPRPWNTSWLLNNFPLTNSILGFACFFLGAACMAHQRRAFLFFLIASAGVVAFPILAPFQSLRYFGPVLLAFVAALWMMPMLPERSWKRSGILLLLVLQIPAGIAMTMVSQRMPRSMASTTVAWLQHNGYGALPVIAHPPQAIPALSGYLQRPVYSPAIGATMGACDWTSPPYRPSPEDMRHALEATPYTEAILVLRDTTLISEPGDRLRITRLPSFAPSLIGSEEHHIYLVERSE